MLAVLKVMICYTSAVQQHNTIEHKWLNPVFGSFVNVENFFYVPLPMSILNPSTLFLNLARPFLSLRLVDFSLLKMFVKFRKSLKKEMIIIFINKKLCSSLPKTISHLVIMCILLRQQKYAIR